MSQFYLYVYLDPRKPGKYTYTNISFFYEPIYIGKGKGSRASSHIKEATTRKSLNTQNNLKLNKIKKIVANGQLPIILIISTGSESEILELESFYIKSIGQLIFNSGPLTNIKIDNSQYSPRKYHNKSTNYRSGIYFKSMYNQSTNTVFRIKTEDVQLYKSFGFIELESWSRPTKNNTMSRAGTANPMFNKSAVKNRKWVTINNQSMMLTADEIEKLTIPFCWGRKVFKNKRKRVIIHGELRAKYMSELQIAELPKGTKYQYGLIWNETKKTYIKD